MVRGILIILSLYLVIGCEKAIDFAPRSTEQAVVVDALIENGRVPEVRLSRSLNYFTKLSPELLSASFIRNAVVTISNGTRVQRLKEYSRSFLGGYSVYYYSIDSTGGGVVFKGEAGKQYTLTIKAEGKEFTATTTIPELKKKINHLWWKKAPSNPDPEKVVLMANMVDPPGLGNYIRYYVQLERAPFYPTLNSVFDDQITDGTTYDVQLESGVNRSDDIDKDEYGFFYKGDSITVKFCNIDKSTYDFWRTMEYNYSSIGNPFSSPTKVLSNINNGALGYFGGYNAQYISVVVR